MNSLPGVIMSLKGVPAFQMALGFHQPYKIDSGRTICLLIAQDLRS